MISWALPDYAHPRTCHVCDMQQIRKTNSDLEVFRWCSSSCVKICECAKLASEKAAIVAKFAAEFARSVINAFERAREAAQDAARVSLAASNEMQMLLCHCRNSIAVRVATRASTFANEIYTKLCDEIARVMITKKKKKKKKKIKKRLLILPANKETSVTRKRVGGGFSVVNTRRTGHKKKLKVKLKRRKKLRWNRTPETRVAHPSSKELCVGRNVQTVSTDTLSSILSSGLRPETKRKKILIKKTRRISVLRGSKKPIFSSVK